MNISGKKMERRDLRLHGKKEPEDESNGGIESLRLDVKLLRKEAQVRMQQIQTINKDMIKVQFSTKSDASGAQIETLQNTGTENDDDPARTLAALQHIRCPVPVLRDVSIARRAGLAGSSLSGKFSGLP
jgi:hypothetical protein